jgi:hypothetical protein
MRRTSGRRARLCSPTKGTRTRSCAPRCPHTATGPFGGTRGALKGQFSEYVRVSDRKRFTGHGQLEPLCVYHYERSRLCDGEDEIKKNLKRETDNRVQCEQRKYIHQYVRDKCIRVLVVAFTSTRDTIRGRVAQRYYDTARGADRVP